ncbi:hypothetical protein [Nocardia sp. CA-120079]|uniref:alpha/beta hydrolase n=1 Tax=Nocardia sp. CA-120079 TaxID=3239974 RepID=UPI003D963982
MSVIDAVVSAAAILFTMAAAVFPRRVAYALPVALPLLVFGCLIQFVLEDFYWQMVPCYLAIVAATVLVVSRSRRTQVTEPTRKRRVRTVLAPVTVGLLAVLAILPWSIPPVPTLPEPTGRYRIGSAIFRWIDEQRPETSTDSTADRRNVIVQAWYPTDDTSGRQWVYLDGQERLPSRVTQIPGFIMHNYGRIDTHADADVPISAERARWPVVLFSPGYGAPRAFYTGLVSDLASRTDVPLFLAAPVRFAVAQFIGGERGPVDTQRATNDILVAFLQDGDIRAAAIGHPNIHGGPVP